MNGSRCTEKCPQFLSVHNIILLKIYFNLLLFLDPSKDKQPITDSHLIAAIDYNLLLVFLLANLLTGIVNMSIDTIAAQPITGFVIVTMYMMVVCTIALVLYSYKIRIKFW